MGCEELALEALQSHCHDNGTCIGTDVDSVSVKDNF